MKCASPPRLAFDPDSPSHELHELSGNRQAEAAAPVAPSGRAIGLPERLKDTLMLVRGNANARVAHRKLELDSLLRFLGDLDFDENFPDVGKLHRVSDE